MREDLDTVKAEAVARLRAGEIGIAVLATYLAMSRRDEALADFSRAVQLDPSLSGELGQYMTTSGG